MKNLQMKKLSLMAAVAAIFTFFATQAMAITAPAAGSFGYEAYNFLVTTLLKGPFGAIAAILLFLVTILLFVAENRAGNCLPGGGNCADQRCKHGYGSRSYLLMPALGGCSSPQSKLSA